MRALNNGRDPCCLAIARELTGVGATMYIINEHVPGPHFDKV
jgi:hypothetical protein